MPESQCAIRVNDSVEFQAASDSDWDIDQKERGVVTRVTEKRGGFLVSILSCGRTYMRYADRVTLLVPASDHGHE
jgi:hypothetical protein